MKKFLLASAMVAALASCGGSGVGKTPGRGTLGKVGTATQSGDQVKIKDGSSVTIDSGTTWGDDNGLYYVSITEDTENPFGGSSQGVVAAYVDSKGSVLTGISNDRVNPTTSTTYKGVYRLIVPTTETSEFDYSDSVSLAVDLDAGTVKTSSGDLKINAKIDGNTFDGTVKYVGSDFAPASGKSGSVGGGFYDIDGSVVAGTVEGDNWAGVFTAYTWQ